VILLDTNALYWYFVDSPKLGRAARNLLESSRQVFFSPISLLELRIKSLDAAARGRSTLRLPDDLTQLCAANGMLELPVKGEIEQEVTRFQSLIGHDPMDRIILAQASKHDLRLLTSDQTLLSLGFDWVIDAQD
jgi:PIN domain nuclease of toxin-antitoxin system